LAGLPLTATLRSAWPILSKSERSGGQNGLRDIAVLFVDLTGVLNGLGSAERRPAGAIELPNLFKML
jgi:hypothetical protein